MVITKLLLPFLFITIVTGQRVCLHYGCEMSPGLKVHEINSTVGQYLKGNEFKENVITAVSWNIRQKDTSRRFEWAKGRKDVCRFLTKLDPTFLGLQEVSSTQIDYIKSCMKNHRILKPKNDNGKNVELQNILVFKNTQHIKIKDYGVFQADPLGIAGLQPSSCTWAKVQFKHILESRDDSEVTRSPLKKDEEKSSVVQRLFNLLTFLLPQKNKTRNARNRVRRDSVLPYRRSHFFVAVMKINSFDAVSAKQRFKMILTHLRNKITERRRFPLILLVDLGQEDNSLAYKYIEQHFNWIRNTMAHSKKNFPAMTIVNINDPSSELLSDYVFKYRFAGLISAVISDDIVSRDGVSSHRPVMSAMLRYRG